MILARVLMKKTLLYEVFLIVTLLFCSLISHTQGLQISHVTVISSGMISYSSGMSKLRVEGIVIKDAYGRKIRLTGFNGHPYHDRIPQHTMKEEDVKWIADQGFNAIRAIIWWYQYEPVEGQIDGSYFTNYLDPFLSWCEKYGIYVILDMHTGWLYGLPDWAKGNYSDAHSFYMDFWEGLGHASHVKDKYVENWMYIANRYVGRDVIAGYGLMNEPWTGMETYDERAYIAPMVMSYYNNELVPAIRGLDPETIIFFDAMNPGRRPYTFELNTKQQHPNIVWGSSTYEYCRDYNDEWAKPEEVKQVAQAKIDKFVVEFGCPFFATEMGWDVHGNETCQWLSDYLNSFEDVVADPYSFSYAWWRYDKGGTMGIREADGTPRPELAILQEHILSAHVN